MHEKISVSKWERRDFFLCGYERTLFDKDSNVDHQQQLRK